MPRIITQDHRQDEQVDDNHNRSCEQYDQRDEHLQEKEECEKEEEERGQGVRA